MSYGSPVPGFDAYNNTYGTNALGAVPGAIQNAGFRFAGSALDAKTLQEVTRLNTEAQLLAQMPQQQEEQGFGIGDIASLGLKGLSLAGGLGAFGGGGGGAAIGGAIGGNAGFAGVDSGVLDSVLGNAGSYSSGMTSLF